MSEPIYEVGDCPYTRESGRQCICATCPYCGDKGCPLPCPDYCLPHTRGYCSARAVLDSRNEMPEVKS